MKRGAQSAGLIIRAKSGVFEGFKSSNTVRCWKGIPYAEAPTGDLRFKAPQKAANRHTESAFSAKTFSPSCPSYGSAAGSGTVFEEDCLTLNIWSPASISSGNLVAVMIYFTGGGYISGSSREPRFDGNAFIRDHNNILLVTYNYRVSLWGFPAGSGTASAALNAGLQDQRMVVEWVRDNIEAFGGNPRDIVLFGESAGAASIASYTHAYIKDPIARAIILQSGSESLNTAITVPIGDQHSVVAWSWIAAKVGCYSTNQAQQFSCMQAVELANLSDAVNLYEGSDKAFLPTRDGVHMFSHEAFSAANAAGNFARLPTLIGTNSDEGTVLVSQYSHGLHTPDLATSITAFLFTCPAEQFSQDRERARVPVWQYRYAGVWNDISDPDAHLGAYHTSELAMIFGNLPASRYTVTRAQRLTMQIMQAAWAAFAKDPYSGLTKFGWPQYSSGGDTLIEIAANYVGEPLNVLEAAQLPIVTFQSSRKYTEKC